MNLLLAIVGTAAAHHGTATTRVDSAAQATLASSSGVPAPRLELGIGLGARSFARTMAGTAPFAGDPLGTVAVQQLTASLRYTLRTRTHLLVQVPIARIHTQSATGEPTSVAGLSDVSAAVGQDLWVWKGPETRTSPRLVWRAQGGLSAPTGRYDAVSRFQITQVDDTGDGGLDIITYDTRATLGSGAWALSAATALDWMPSDRVGLVVSAATSVPVTRAPDEVRWGSDLEATLGGRASLLANRLTVGGQLAARHHTRDEIDAIDEETGQTVRDRVGGRDQVSVGAAVQGRLSRALVCSAQVSAPVWQRAGGIQLMETWSTSASCSLGVSTKRR